MKYKIDEEFELPLGGVIIKGEVRFNRQSIF
jgi:hypothetical protein